MSRECSFLGDGVESKSHLSKVGSGGKTSLSQNLLILSAAFPKLRRYSLTRVAPTRFQWEFGAVGCFEGTSPMLFVLLFLRRAATQTLKAGRRSMPMPSITSLAPLGEMGRNYNRPLSKLWEFEAQLSMRPGSLCIGGSGIFGRRSGCSMARSG